MSLTIPRAAFLVAVASLAACQHDAPAVASALRQVVTREVVLREGAVHLVVEHEGNEAWATYVADRAAAYLPAAETYFDVPFHRAAAALFRDCRSRGRCASWGARR